MKKNIIIIISIVIAAVFARFAFTQFNQLMAEKAAKSRPAPGVVVESVGEDSIIRVFEAPGRVVSKYQVNVLARISGYLQKSFFKEGDYVKEGQVLFQIESREYENAVKVATANIANTSAQLAYAEKQLARAAELVKMDYISKAQYDSLLSQRDALRAQLTSAQAQLNDANRNFGYTMVKAPVNGIIGLINVTVGNYVTPSSGALATINSTNPMYVTFPLEATDFALISESDKENNKNRKIELVLPGGQKYDIDGVQDFQDNKVDVSTGTVTMRATFNNPNNQLIHGEFVTVKLFANKSVNVPVVPQIAVQENQAGKFVYKLDEENIPQITYIKTGRQSGDNWVVEDGLQKGDRVVVDGLQKVIPGKPVTIMTAEEMEKIKKSEEHNEAEEK